MQQAPRHNRDEALSPAQVSTLPKIVCYWCLRLLTEFNIEHRLINRFSTDNAPLGPFVV